MFLKLFLNLLTYFSKDMIANLIQYENTSGDKNGDAILYVFLTRIVNFLAFHNRETAADELLCKIVKLEETIGFADTASSSLYEQVLREKQLLYIFYSNEVLKCHT